MSFENTITLSNIFAIIAGFFALYQYKKNLALKRASYISELTEKIRSDPDMQNVVYLFDYNQEWYNLDFHNSGELERKVDKTLSFFSFICYLRKKRLIAKSDFCFFQYEIRRILMNQGVIDYFYNLYHFSKQNNAPITFSYLFEYGEKNRFFAADFYDKEAYKKCNKYHHYLNF